MKFKIFIGYAMLILLLGFIIYLFRGERVKRDELKREMKELGVTRALTRKAYGCLLELASQGEVASIWSESDLRQYREKREKTCGVLKELREFVHVPRQQERIDSVCLLLEQKEMLLAAAMSTFDELESIGKTVGEKVPVIVRQVRRQPAKRARALAVKEVHAGEGVSGEEPPEKEKSFLKRIFSGKEKKSAYRQQRERRQAAEEKALPPAIQNDGNNAAVHLLHSLDREVAGKQKEQREKLFTQMDSLHNKSRLLNRRLNGLAGDFEKAAGLRWESRYGSIIMENQESYAIATTLAFFAFVLAIVLYAIVHRDVNRRIEYERRLEKSNRKNKELLQSKKKMMLSIAHDLRSPLAVIKESAELLPGMEEKAKRDDYVENICHSSDYMLSLVNTLMEFYLLDTGQIRLHATLFSLSAFFKETAKNYNLLSKKKQLRFITRFSGLDVIVNGDRGHLQQIITNLLSNALKFTGKGTIILDAEYNNKELCFSVQDSGAGMRAEDKQRIFNAFERLENAGNTPGFGLGLAITARLVKRMNGEIAVESQPGRGSTFSVFLPLSAADGNSDLEEAKPVTDYQLENVRVLVIDDDRIQQKITCEMFSQNHVACDCCTNSWELTGLLKRNDYDLLLTDIQMPEVDGFGILEMLRSSNIEKAKCIPVIAVTARPDDDNEYLSKGFVACIHKPFSMEQLMEITCKAIGPNESKSQKPDFSVILSGEDDKREMLRLFIEETRKDLASIHAAMEQNDLKTIHSILHKNLPLWETVRLNYPIMKIKELVIAETEQWTEKQVEEIHAIIRSVEALINFAEHKLQENK